ncbi:MULTISPECIES: hypothetical protein [unclassified Stappia]|jgi:hypothetical protein|uniref:hypothetical protein n=1 Tax=unclassified Stappia TaxID=2629676 RepID=UPI00273FED42|nr:hypothetical protein [Stappia sp. MMSF_3263]
MQDTENTDLEFDEGPVTDQDIRRMALGYIDDAFAEAVADGIDSAAVAHAALFTAFADLVASFGEEAVAQLAEGLPERVRRGDYTIFKPMH